MGKLDGWSNKPHLSKRGGRWWCEGCGRRGSSVSPSLALLLWQHAFRNDKPARPWTTVVHRCMACGNTHPPGMPCPHVLFNGRAAWAD